MNYIDFKEETKAYFNKVIEIYLSIKDKNIIKQVKDITLKEYEYTLFDKKILSLFIAGFLVDGNLKKILSQYNNIRLNDFLDFIDIKEENIIKIENDKYEELFNNYFKLDLMTIIKERNYNRIVNFITPEVVVNSLQYISLSGSYILDYFAKTYKLASVAISFSDHPFFKALENYNIIEGSITKIEKNNTRNRFERRPSVFSELISPISSPKLFPDINIKKQIKQDDLDKNKHSYTEIIEEIQKKFIGQESAVKDLFYNIINNQDLSVSDDIYDGERSIIFLDGPTGTGKTAITREITEKLKIPFTSTSITNYSSTGYVGGNLTDVLKELYRKSDDDLEKAQKGIVVFDEFDKIAYSRSGGLEMKKEVQQQLLDFLGGGKYSIRIGDGIFDREEIEFDTSRLTFICLGALTDLRTSKTEQKSSIGFIEINLPSEVSEYSITPQDLVNIGLERELVGRFNTYLHTDDYSKETLEKILKESKISPIIGLKNIFKKHGKQLIIDDDVYRLIASLAYELNTGARSLQTIVNGIRSKFLEEIYNGENNIIHLDAKIVSTIIEKTISRKGRR